MQTSRYYHTDKIMIEIHHWAVTEVGLSPWPDLSKLVAQCHAA
jgi:hypothetical protein